MIFPQVLQIVGEAVSDSDAPGIAIAEVGGVFFRYVTRERFFSL